MAVDAEFQAMPEDCDLIRTARQDREIAELTEFFQNIVKGRDTQLSPDKWDEFVVKAQKVLAERPGLGDRYFNKGARMFDAIVYLLSPFRRTGEYENDPTLIYQAIYGEEPLHPEAKATQGHPIGFVSARKVAVIADYLDQITPEMLREHYDPNQMAERGVYKIFRHDGDDRLKYIWGEVVGIRGVYRAAADHGEGMLAIID
jgi:hypothetical protein